MLTLIIIALTPRMSRETVDALRVFIYDPHLHAMDEGNLGQMMKNLLKALLAILIVPFILLVFAAAAGSLIQNPFHISLDPITPKWEKVSPIKGLGRLFSMRSIMEFLKGLIKITIIGIISYHSVKDEVIKLEQLPAYEMAELLRIIKTLIVRMLIGICIALFFIAILDYLYQRFEYRKNLRMSKQEIKDEYKQQEGDPHVKQRIRSIRMERARKRMMAAVPTADVVLTNPTHYAVALKYDMEKMKAPVVVAKGADRIALKIREIAEENKVPIVRNPPLARALHDNVDIDKEIPYEHYKAVAEVISYIFKMKGKMMH
jgi:flagellar biosynthetic protein FlhB